MRGTGPLALSILLVGLFVGARTNAGAQQLILKGEFGLLGGTMAPPGLYTGVFTGEMWNDELKDQNGNSVPSQGGSFNQYIVGPLISYVSKFKLFGANYGAIVGIPFANATIDFPRLNTQGSTGMAISQLWVVPFSLGWHFERSDLTVHYAFYPPTGRYTPGAPNNTGLGMWCNEFSLRATVFPDAAKDWHLSASFFYDINSKKKDTDFTTGSPFTLMYGVGHNYDSGKLFKGWAGVVGYAQWQVTASKGADVPQFVTDSRTQIYGIGPEFTTLQGAFTIRYFWQFGGKFSTQGQTLYAQFVLPLPF